MENTFIYAAGAISLLSALLHLFGGSPEFAKPLRNSTELNLSIRSTLWMCWHMVTAALLVIPTLIALYLWCGDEGYIKSALILNTGIGLAGFFSKFYLKVSFKVLFQGWLFVPVTLLLAWAMHFS